MYFEPNTLYGRSNGRDPDFKPRLVCQPIAQDRKAPSAKSIFKRAKKLENNYAARLRRIARHIGDIVREFPQGTIEASIAIRAAMERYSRLLEPWAEAVGSRMIAEVTQRDDTNWKQISGQIGRALHKEIETAPTGNAMRAKLAEQVTLITSLPIEAAERVHKLTTEGISQGRRAAEISADIMKTGEVTKARADCIGRTEVARTASVLTQARAEYVGSTHYIWRTAGDSDVRKGHKALSGKTIAWSDPPECDPGHHAHAGQIFNCRCYAEPIIG